MVDELHVSIIDDAPYVGPSPFEYKHRGIFFGRDREADKLVSLITAHPITLLYAPSGAGKTSLINAKLIPMLKKEGFDVLPPARVQSQAPITIPHDSIRNIFVFNSILDWTKDEGVEQSEVAQKTLAECLAETVRPRAGAAGGDGHGEEPARVLIFDQMEEVFTLYPERWKDRQDFFRQIRDAISPRDKSRAGQGGAAVTSPLRVLFIMREDYIAGLDPYAHLLPEKVRTRFRLEHLRDESALDAIKLPLVGTKWGFAEGVAERLRDDLLKTPSTNPGGEWESAQFVEPVQLQVVCQNLWMGLVKEDKEVITFDHLKKYGNVDEALLGFYERSVAHVVKKTQVSEGLVRAWFGRKLIRREGVRGIVYRGDTHTAKLPNDAVDELVRLHLIKGELKGSSQWYELSHDRLITPIRQSNERWVLGFKALGETVRHLEDRAEEWDKSGRQRSLLLDQGELHQAKRIFRSAGDTSIVASPELDDLIDASKTAHSSRRNRFLKAALAASVALLLVMSFLVYFAISRNNAALAYARDAMMSANAARAAERAAKDAEKVAREKELEAENNLEELKKAQAEERKALAAADVAKQKAVKALGAAKRAEAEAKAQKARAEAEAAIATAAKAKIESQQTQLEDAARLWKASAEDAKRQKELAEALKGRAETLKNIADARLLTASSRETFPVDKELSLNLAKLAVNKLKDVPGEGLSARLKARRGQLATEVERAFRDSIAPFIGQHAVVRNVGGRRQDVAFSPDGRLFAALGSETRTDSAESQCTKTTPCVWDANGSFVKALKGHTNRVQAIAFSPDNTHIATEADDSTGRIWDVKSDKVITLTGLKGRVAALAFNSDGKLLITEAGTDRAVIWNASTGEQVSELKGLKSPIASLAFSPDDKLILVKGFDGSIVTWDAKTLQPLFPPVAAYRGDDYCLGFSPDSKTILATDPDRVLTLLDARTGSAVASFGNQSAIYSAAFDSSGRRIVTGGADGKVVVWDFVRDDSAREKGAASGRADKDKGAAFGGGGGKYMDNVRESATLSGHTDRVNSVAFSGDGKYIISASDDKTAFIWDAQSHLLVRELTGHVKHVNRAVLSSGHVFTVGEDQTVRVWDYVAKDNMTALSGYNDGVNVAVFSPDGNYVAAAVQDGRIVISDANTGKIIASVRGHSESVNSIAFSADGKRLVSAGADGATRVWAVDIEHASLAEVARLQPTKRPDNAEVKSGVTGAVVTLGVAFSPGKESKYVVTADDDGVARIWEWRKGEKVHDRVLTAPAYCLPEKSCQPPPSGAGMVSSSPAGEAAPPEKADGSVYSAAFSAADDGHADGRYIVTTHYGKVKVWEWNTAEGRKNPTVLLPASADGKGSDFELVTYADASFSPDGRYVVAGGDDANAYVWEWQKGKGNVNPIVLQGHLAVVTSARFDNDGDLLVTAGGDNTVRVWKWNSEERGEPIVLNGGHSAVFSPDDSRILTVSDDQTCLIYPDKYFAPFEELLARVPKSLRPLTREERDKYLDDDEEASRDEQGGKPPATP